MRILNDASKVKEQTKQKWKKRMKKKIWKICFLKEEFFLCIISIPSFSKQCFVIASIAISFVCIAFLIHKHKVF